MADNITGRGERPDLHDNDPFAELTRIMGHDPRQDAGQEGDSDLALDLENELLGTLDLTDDEAPQAVEASPAADEQPWAEEAQQAGHPPQYADNPAEPSDAMSGEVDFVDFDAELDAAFDSGLDDHPALPEETPVKADDLAQVDHLFDADYRAVDDLPDAGHQSVQAEGAADWRDQEWQATADGVADDPRADEWGVAGDQDFDQVPATELDDWSAAFQADEQPEPEIVAAPETVAGLPADDSFDFDDELMMALEAEPDSHESEDLAAAEEPVYETPAERYEDVSHAADIDDGPADAYAAPAPAAEAPRQLSLEEELTMLLAGADRSQPEQAPAFEQPVAPQPAPLRAAEPAAQMPPAQPAAPAPAAEPVAYESSVEPAAAAPAAMSRSSWQSRPAAQSNSDVPEIETVEMASFEPIRSAEFEVPDLPVDEPVQAAGEFDDLAAELGRVFEEGEEQAEFEGLAPAYGASRGDVGDEPNRQPDFDWGTVVTAPAAAAAAGQGPERGAQESYYDSDDIYAGAHAPAADDFAAYRHDDPLAEELPEDRPVLRDNRRRNMMVAGGALALLLLGGVGVFALWSGGSGSGEPVLLQADGEPVRVRPEEPGGTVVPNQDSEVYQRVAGGREESEPSQARLIDTAEEPIDLTVQNAPRIVGPGAEDDAGFGSELAAVKAEDRLDAGADANAAAASDDVVALQPRRVRTMVVRPDGSIVPREDPAPAAAAPAEGTMEAAPQTLEQPSNAAGEAQAAQQADGEGTGAATTDMPDEIALAPVARPEPPAAAASPTPNPAPAPAQQEQQVAAVDPAPAQPQATQTSEWSMQIASQPSAESAQATYQDLARRYSSLLEGRGVNIVSAQVDGRTFYRVRIPMASRDEAVNLCTRYQSAGGSCFVSR
ncbi:MAG: SPOR domain-containing protein [Rhizobiaceae bacterium]